MAIRYIEHAGHLTLFPQNLELNKFLKDSKLITYGETF